MGPGSLVIFGESICRDQVSEWKLGAFGPHSQDVREPLQDQRKWIIFPYFPSKTSISFGGFQ